MGVGGLGHLAETQIEPLGEEDVQESDPFSAWRSRAQVGESVGEVAFPLAAKAGNVTRRHGLQQIGGRSKPCRNSRRSRRLLRSAEFRPTSNRRNQTTPAHAAVDFLVKQSVETHEHGIVQASGDARLYPARCGNEWTRAKTLQDRENRLTGTISPWLGSLSGLELLRLSGNRVGGSVPAELAGLVNLEWLDLSGKRLVGWIPRSLSDVLENDLTELALPSCDS